MAAVVKDAISSLRGFFDGFGSDVSPLKAALVGLGVGVGVGLLVAKKLASRSSSFKSQFNQSNPMVQYLYKNSLRESDDLAFLREVTSHLTNGRMLSAPEQQQFFRLLAMAMGFKKTLDVGTFTGYSAASMASVLPKDGKVVAMDVSPIYPEYGGAAFAGCPAKVDLRIQPASKTLDDLLAAGEAGTYDFAFIDADKTNYDAYFEKCYVLVRKGGIIAIDNVFWAGRAWDPRATDADTMAIKALNAKLSRDPRIAISMLPIADGVTLCLKL